MRRNWAVLAYVIITPATTDAGLVSHLQIVL
jgi:hypothetical protein